MGQIIIVMLLWKEGRKEGKSIYISLFGQGGTLKATGMDHTVLPANNTMPAWSEIMGGYNTPDTMV